MNITFQEAFRQFDINANGYVARAVKRGARMIINSNFSKIDFALDLPYNSIRYPLSNETLKMVRDRMKVMKQLGVENHYAYSANQMMALKQAYVAIRYKRIYGRLN